MADGQEFGVGAALALRVDEGSLRQARQEIEQELGSVQVGVDGGGGGTFAGSTAIGDGGGLAAAGAGVQRQQLGVLEDIHDELEQIGASGGFGAGGGAGGGLLSRVGGSRGGVGGGLLGGLLAGGPLGLAAAIGVGGAAATNPGRTGDVASDPGQVFRPGQLGATLGTLVRGTLPGLLAGAVTDTSGDGSPSNTQSTTTEQGAPPQTVSISDLVGVDQGDLTRDGDSGTSSGLTGAELRNILQQGLLPESAITQFVSAVETFSTRVGTRRTETPGGETIPPSPVDPTGRAGQGGGAPRGRRGRLSPGPNATPTERTANRAAERQQTRQDITVNNDVTVPVENAVTERELQRELELLEQRIRRNLGGR